MGLPVLQLVALAYLAFYASARSVQFRQQPLSNEIHPERTDLGPQLSLEAWIERQEKISFENLLANIAPGGRNVPDAALGTVVASPSKQEPNYWFQWIRDAGITMGTVVRLYTQNPSSTLTSTTLIPIIESYANLSTRIQHTDNPSGTFHSALSGLGEPKFHIDGSAFTGSWGRPQRDGPALRALTLMSYLRAYNASNPALWTGISTKGNNPYADLYDGVLPADSVIKADLEYVARYWQHEGFDLWEEVRGLHFFTAIVQLRALKEGAGLAGAFGDYGASRWYADQAKDLENLVEKFWNEDKGHIVAMLDSSRSGLDCGNLLGSIHGSSKEYEGPFPPWSDEMLVTLLGLVKDQRYRFPINSVPEQERGEFVDELAGVGVGRYPEDIYDGYGTSPSGGNPWFLCTASVAEILFQTSTHLSHERQLKFTKRGAPFWDALLPNLNVKPDTVYKADTKEFEEALRRLKSTGDSFLAVIRKHTDGEGALSEQFDRWTGFERGARDLTWSYGAFLQAVDARRALIQH